MPGGLACKLLLAVADGVDYAHRDGVCHRDLKPENILLLNDRCVVSDFGLCRDLSKDSTTFTQSNTVFGTPYYMASEQYDNAHEIGPQADVFALGRILYHMLTGRLPYRYQHLDLVPRGFDYVVEVSTVEEPRDRYRSVAEFMSNLVEAQSVTAPARTSAGPGVTARSAIRGRSRRPANRQQLSLFDLMPYDLPSLPPAREEVSSGSGGRSAAVTPA
jgi:serine/threonine protein kinase